VRASARDDDGVGHEVEMPPDQNVAHNLIWLLSTSG
jgi:hypothetical protein